MIEPANSEVSLTAQCRLLSLNRPSKWGDYTSTRYDWDAPADEEDQAARASNAGAA